MAHIMVTDGGPHAPEKWAAMTAERIFPIDPGVTGERLHQAEQFRLTIAELLMPHHTAVQTNERTMLAHDIGHLLTPYAVEGYVAHIVKDIVDAAKHTPWQAHFARDDVQDAIRLIIGGDLTTIQHIERLWHAGNHPEQAEAQTYNQMWS